MISAGRIVGKLREAFRSMRKHVFACGLALLILATIGELIGSDWVGEQVSQLGLLLMLGAVIFER